MPHFSPADVIQGTDKDLLCQARRDPLVLSGLFVEITKQLFLNPHYLYRNVQTWSPTNEAGHVFIGPTSVWTDTDVNRRPAIFIDIGDLSYSTRGVQGFGGQAGVNLAEGITYYNREVKSNVVWAHVGRTRGQALQYACVTLDLVDAFSDVIRADFCFEKFDVRGILRPKQRKDQPKEWVCNVQADFQFLESFGIKLESPKLKTITLKLDDIIC